MSILKNSGVIALGVRLMMTGYPIYATVKTAEVMPSGVGVNISGIRRRMQPSRCAMTEEQIIFSSKNLRIGERIDVATTGRISDLFRDIRLNNKGYGDHFGTIRDPLKPLTLKWIYDYVKFLRSMATQLENIADEAGGRTEQVRDE